MAEAPAGGDPDHAALFADVLDLRGYQIIRRDGRRIALGLQACVILATLAQARDDADGPWRGKRTLAAAIFGDVRQETWARTWDAIVRVRIHDLRAKIVGCSFRIESDAREQRGLGYCLAGPIRVRNRKGIVR